LITTKIKIRSKKMPNKIKLNLEDLKIESFVTSLKDEEKDKIKGGSGAGCSLTECAFPHNC
jgi:hypothetical protein